MLGDKFLRRICSERKSEKEMGGETEKGSWIKFLHKQDVEQHVELPTSGRRTSEDSDVVEMQGPGHEVAGRVEGKRDRESDRERDGQRWRERHDSPQGQGIRLHVGAHSIIQIH